MTSFSPNIATRPKQALSAAPAARQPAHSARRIDVATLLPDGGIDRRSVTVPALPMFEETATALARGTLLPTPNGPRAVEDLVPGDSVVDASGIPETVRWIGSTTYLPGRVPADSALQFLVRVTGNPGDEAAVSPDLLAGPGARFEVRHPRLDRLLGNDAVLAPITEYVDGDRFIEVRPFSPVQLFHIALDRHCLIGFGSVRIESYHPGGVLGAITRLGFRGVFLALFAGQDPAEAFGPARFSRTSRAAIDALLDGRR